MKPSSFRCSYFKSANGKTPYDRSMINPYLKLEVESVFGKLLVRPLAYADDLTLLAHTPVCLHRLFVLGENYTHQNLTSFSVLWSLNVVHHSCYIQCYCIRRYKPVEFESHATPFLGYLTSVRSYVLKTITRYSFNWSETRVDTTCGASSTT